MARNFFTYSLSPTPVDAHLCQTKTVVQLFRTRKTYATFKLANSLLILVDGKTILNAQVFAIFLSLRHQKIISVDSVGLEGVHL